MMILTAKIIRCVTENKAHLGGYGKVGFYRRLCMGLVGVANLDHERD